MTKSRSKEQEFRRKVFFTRRSWSDAFYYVLNERENRREREYFESTYIGF